MTEAPDADRRSQQLHAALDGELDAFGMLEFEKALSGDSKLAARYEQLMTLRDAMRRHAADCRAPDALREKIAAMAGGPAPVPASRMAFIDRRPRMAMAAAVALAFLAGAAGARLASRYAAERPEQVAMLLIDDHRRALLASEPIDVASSDRHTVKPWFDARLALSPPVIDLSATGVVLVGGRADVVEGSPVPTIVYRVREHYISLTALPAPRFAAASRRDAVNGYSTVSWSDGAFAYWAVSDIPLADLEGFAAAFRAGAAANVESH